ncbi:ABC transporter ATP-binding protein [Krasilnikovia sp. MM14-A1004]|uniref:ABC transporter ATP-binding protein n=1 Tax=Krasilnikovia sp. MM14-A1004 TaxID=3373541 RepID=UPI00399C6303
MARLLSAEARAVTGMVGLAALAAAAALVPPRLLGHIVDLVAADGAAAVPRVDRLALGIVAATVAQILLTRWALLVAHRFGERTGARVREQFLDRALALPAATIERVTAGDLAARGTGDVGAVAATLRDAVPEVFVAATQAVFLLGAVLLVAPVLGAAGLLALGGAGFAARWYLRRARAAYLDEGAASSALADELAATVAGARTVEALGLQGRRVAAGREAVGWVRRARLRTLFLRSVLFPIVDVSYVLPVVAVLLLGGLLYRHAQLTLGAVTACALYLRQLGAPLDIILVWMERLQASGASFARLEGLAAVPPAPVPGTALPTGDRIEMTGVWYAYDGGPDVLRGVDLTVRPGERLAVVGVSGAGKSTLVRLLAGVDRPRAGTVTVGGVPVAELPPQVLRRQVVLVTQEHHVFRDTLRDNLRLAAPGATDLRLRAALATVGADWLNELPAGLDTDLGRQPLDGARAQQLALARVVLANPHTVLLDEATALLDPATARGAERALAAVLRKRTVVAVAHRLQTARDADRVAVLDAGRVVELGSHDELLRAGGAYAALWHAWHGGSGS